MRLKEAQNHQMHDMRALDTQAYVHSPRTVHGMPYYDYSPALSEPHSALASHPNSPYFACAPALPQSFSFTQPSASIAAPKPEHIVPSQGQAEPQGHHPQYHGIDGFPAPYTPPYESGSYTNTPVMGYVDRIELRDLGDKPLFASECDSPDSASEMSLPQTPSTMGSTTDRFGGMSSGIGIDPSPFDG